MQSSDPLLGFEIRCTVSQAGTFPRSSLSGKGLIKSRATLVVCPASLVHQWAKEIENRCQRDHLKVLVYHGANRENDIKRSVNKDSQ